MRRLLFTLLLLTCSAQAEEALFTKSVKASLVFREDPAKTPYYPHLLQVFLRLDSIVNAEVLWAGDPAEAIKAELLDARGKPVPQPGHMTSMMSNTYPYNLPPGSRLDWLISNSGGISFFDSTKDSYVLIVGGNGWLIPRRKLGSYSLRVRWYGAPNEFIPDRARNHSKLLLELTPVRIKLSR